MKYYYQIKGKKGEDDYSFSNWAFPPIFSGKVEAPNKKEAKLQIEKDYGRSFPMRVLQKDLDSNEFLLALHEMDKDSRYHALFEKLQCIVCGTFYRVIDKYNDTNCRDKSAKVCCDECKEEEYKVRQIEWNEDNVMNGKHLPVIYKITHKTNGLSYIGKTTQAFTLRWYQHFFQGGTASKFHKAINESKVTDWIYEVVEIVKITGIHNFKEAEDHVFSREKHWIKALDTVNNGYNSIN